MAELTAWKMRLPPQAKAIMHHEFGATVTASCSIPTHDNDTVDVIFFWKIVPSRA